MGAARDRPAETTRFRFALAFLAAAQGAQPGTPCQFTILCNLLRLCHIGEGLQAYARSDRASSSECIYGEVSI